MKMLKIGNKDYELLISEDINLKEENLTAEMVEKAIQVSESMISEVKVGEDFMIINEDIEKTIICKKMNRVIVVSSILPTDNTFII